MNKQQLDDLRNHLFADIFDQASAKDLLQDNTKFDVALRSKLKQKSPESFRLCNDERREGFVCSSKEYHLESEFSLQTALGFSNLIIRETWHSKFCKST